VIEKVVLKGAFPEKNFGDDIMLVVVYDYLIKNNFLVNIYGGHLEYLNFLNNSNVND